MFGPGELKGQGKSENSVLSIIPIQGNTKDQHEIHFSQNTNKVGQYKTDLLGIVNNI